MIKKILAFFGYRPIPALRDAELPAIEMFNFESKADLVKIRKKVYELLYALNDKDLKNMEYAINLIRNASLQALIDSNPNINMDSFSNRVKQMRDREDRQIAKLTELNIEQLTGMTVIQYMQYIKMSEEFNKMEKEPSGSIN